MRSVDANTTTALLEASSKGQMVRDFVYIIGKDALDVVTPWGYWNDIEDVSFDVISGVDGNSVSRVYHGDGSLLEVDDIPTTLDSTIRTIDIKLALGDPIVQDMFQNGDIRHAHVEIHRGIFDPETHNVVGDTYPHFIGKINKAPLTVGSPGSGKSLSLEVVSATRELTRTNTEKRSDESQKLRSGDRFYKYAGVVGGWDIFWGEEKDTSGSGSGSGSGKTGVLGA